MTRVTRHALEFSLRRWYSRYDAASALDSGWYVASRIGHSVVELIFIDDAWSGWLACRSTNARITA